MPIYIQLTNLIVNKEAVKTKYKGGIDSFRKRYFNEQYPCNQEDNHLFVLARMNSSEFNIEELTSKGLYFDNERQHSNDFTVYSRYGGFHWELNWIKSYGSLFLAHKESSQTEMNKVKEFCNTNFDELIPIFEKIKYSIVIKDSDILYV